MKHSPTPLYLEREELRRLQAMYKSKYKKTTSKITRRNKARRIFGLVLKTSLPIAIIIALVFLSGADFLQIRDFEILGTETIRPDSIKKIAQNFTAGTKLFLVPKSNILLLSKDKLAAVLLSYFPRIEKVKVNKQFFSKKIELSIVERKKDFLWCSKDEICFFMTKDGLVFGPSSEALTKFGKVIFRGILEGNPIMRNFTTAEKMQNYLTFIKALEKSGFTVYSINIESSDKALAKTDIGDVIFNPGETNPTLMAQNTILLINEMKNKNPSVHFQYIDARFGNKFFYKLY